MRPRPLSALTTITLCVVALLPAPADSASPERWVAPAVDVASLEADDAAREASGRPVPYRFATGIDVALTPHNAGAWTAEPNGTEVWRLEIASPGALNLSLGLARFDLPTGGLLRILDGDGESVLGPYTPADRNAAGGLWTPVVAGDALVVEARVPAGSRPRTNLLIAAVNHGYRPLDPKVGLKQEACNVDAVCPEGDPFRNEIRAVAQIIVGGQYTCTATLLNNTAMDETPFVITAQHCFDDFPDPAQTATTVVLYWNFESPTCGRLGGGSRGQNQSGSSLVALSPWDTGSDLVLLELDEPPPSSFNVFYAGWDARDRVPGGVVAIHHPVGDEKALAIDSDPGVLTNLFSDIENPNGTFLKTLQYESGLTEGGSSGACIFDVSTGRCVGTLTGGDTMVCPQRIGSDWYARTFKQWTGEGTPDSRLSDWLDPLGTGALVLDGMDPNGNGGGDASRWLVPAAASTPGVGTSNWKTALHLVNPTVATMTATVNFVAGGSAWPGAPIGGEYTLGPGEAVWLDDPLLGLNPTSGLIWVGFSEAGGLVASRTFNLAGGGATFGQGIPGVSLDGAVAPSELVLPLATSIPDRFRVNLGLVQTSAGSWSARVTIFDASGATRASKTYTQSAAFRQVNNVFGDMGLGAASIEGGWILVELSGGAPEYWTAYLSLIDADTSDPTYVAGIVP